MDIVKKFANRWGRRVTRIPLLQKPFLLLSDLSLSASFWANKREREAQLNEFHRCYNLEEKFEFASKVFGSHQIKDEILRFLEFVKRTNPVHICEIGTAQGGTNFLLSQALPSVQMMVGIDLYVKNQIKLDYFSQPLQQLCFVNGSSYSTETVKKVRNLLGDKKLDLLFIDGDHSYEGVKQDFLRYRHFVRDGGLIVFHDIVPDYLTRYGISTGRWVGDVPRFWKEIKLLYPYDEFVENPEQDGLGIGVIHYSAEISLPEGF